ncbi:MAG: Fe-S cluster-containing hydrogenase [Saprospiraceae bacterium]|nr:Fe-S cluster-containing hydrogenase [Saprospiraceae bacterium]
MKEKDQLLWIGEEDLSSNPEWIEESGSEFKPLNIVESLGDEKKAPDFASSRRDFLKYLGFGMGAATVAAGCDIPVKRALPYVIKPDEIVPGVATYYASTYVQGGDFCPILVKTREGRPIKIEGNDLSPVTRGGTSARAQASVLSLYDTNRFRSAIKVVEGEYQSVDWDELDQKVLDLPASSTVRVVSQTLLSPTLRKSIDQFLQRFDNSEHVVYDSVSSAAMLRANERNFGQRLVPNYDFSKAKVIASFNADFLGTWISPVEFARQYAQNRKIDDVHHAKMSRHYQIEGHMSLTGSNADHRILVKPSEQGVAIAYLYNEIVGGASSLGQTLSPEAKKALTELASDLKEAAGESLVISSSNNVEEQLMVNAINLTLNNYGSTLSFSGASLQRQGDEKGLIDLIKEMNGGNVDAMIILDANPAYDNPAASDFASAMKNVELVVSTARQPDESTLLSSYIAPDLHLLESWGDVEAKKGELNVIQPCISPLFKTRSAGESFLKWNSEEETSYHEYLKNNWEENYFPRQTEFSSFKYFWDEVLHNGVFEYEDGASVELTRPDIDLSKVSKPAQGLEIAIYETVNLGNGAHAVNPWLMEMPDPIKRTVWGNYLGVPISFDGDRSYVTFANVKENGQKVGFNIGDKNLALPTFKEFGIHKEVLSLALGYGRTSSGVCANNVGIDVYPFLSTEDDLFQYHISGVEKISDAGEIEDDFACVQHHHTFGVKAIEESTGEVINADEAALVDDAFKWLTKGYQGSLTKRSIIRGANFDELEDFVHELEHEREHHQKLNDGTLYPFDEYYEEKYSQGHYWGMHIDLNACIGCAACTVACMAENNVPVVGKREVSRHHEMTWLRIDRYFYGDVNNPNVVYQPMMCQHCDNAPCENVCPVNATNHSSEGLNQMAYNRCVGTRYCANNCPYKVRRFNWLDYTTADTFPLNEYETMPGEDQPYGSDNLTRMVLNPDVTVRSRGVIEKCSFCVQRLQEGKLQAKVEGRKLRDSDVKTACQTACPTGAITFGDRNNKEGELSRKNESPLNYVVLEETNVRSSVQYSSKIINKNKSLEA